MNEIKPLSEGQQKVFKFMCDYFDENDQLPSCEAIQVHFDWVSQNAALDYQKALEKKGWIERNAAGKYRFSRAIVRSKVPA